MVTFKFGKKSYEANERDALRVLKFYARDLVTWQVVKAWRAKGPIKNTPGRDRRASQGWAGRGKVVGYSTGKTPSQINAATLNAQIRQTQESVRVAVSGLRGEYKSNMAVLLKPASFTARGSPSEFQLNVFFDARGLNKFKRQQGLL